MIPIDKLVHLLVGFVICSVLGTAGHPYLGLVASTLAGVGKEVWDHFNPPHTPDPLDALATIVGGLASFLVQWVFR